MNEYLDKTIYRHLLKSNFRRLRDLKICLPICTSRGRMVVLWTSQRLCCPLALCGLIINIKLTLVRSCWNEFHIFARFDGPSSHNDGLWLYPDLVKVSGCRWGRHTHFKKHSNSYYQVSNCFFNSEQYISYN